MGAALKPSTGWILDGRYELEKEIGQGGMATVWRARHLVLDQPVAVKFLRRSHDEVLRRRFLREARVAAAIRHRHVVNVMDAGTQDEWVYMVMELLDGETLDERLEAGPIDLPTVIRTMAQLLGGLNAVHDAGMIHRDIKPANVMLVDDGDGVFPKLLDFGISKSALVAAESGEHRLASVIPTEENMIVGTPEYMSPEQVRGDRGLSPAADVYSMGALMYELLSGARPFVFKSQTTAAMLIIVATQNPRPLADYRSDLPKAILDFVAKAMDRDPDRRFPNAASMRRALLMAAGKAADRLTEKAPKAAKSLRHAMGAAYEPGDSTVIYLDSGSLPPPPKTPAVTIDSDPVELAPPKKLPWAWIAVAAAGLVAGVGFAFSSGSEPESPSQGEPSESIVATNPDPEPEPDPPTNIEPEQPSMVSYTFRGVPEDGVVRVDGDAIDGTTTRVEQSDRRHVVHVEAPGYLPFVETLSGSADAVLVVALRRDPHVAQPRMTSRMSGTRMSAMSESTMSESAMESETDTESHMTHFRDPGF